ncbi:MAG: hypothetical protein MZU95_09840 [Desulfomicrobium escambiense]|nr:hypothetical protein [Desulfomicrobium escambiense]
MLAHEIRNPLGSIKGFAQYILEQCGKDRQAGTGPPAGSAATGQRPMGTGHGELLGIIIDESMRLETLTRDLLPYARPEDIRVRQIDLSELVSETLQGPGHR